MENMRQCAIPIYMACHGVKTKQTQTCWRETGDTVRPESDDLRTSLLILHQSLLWGCVCLCADLYG